jgi:hypothetical protein
LQSLELGDRVAVALEGSVDDIGSSIVKVGHNGLVLGTVPLHVARLTVAVSVHILVVHVEDGLLAGHPLAVSIGNWGVGGEHASDVPVEQVGVVGQGLCVVSVIVHHDGAVRAETATDTTDDKVNDPGVDKTATDVEVFDGQLTDYEHTEEATELGAGDVGGGVEVGAENGAGDLFHFTFGEPGAENGEVVLSLVGPGGSALLEVVLGKTEANKLVVGNVLGGLGVDLSTLEIIISVLLLLGHFPVATVLARGVIQRDASSCFTHY